MNALSPIRPGASSQDRPRVLVANSTAQSASAPLCAVLAEMFQLHRVSSGRAALEQAPNLQPDLILLDGDLSDLPVAEVTRALLVDRRVSSSTPVLFVTPDPPTFEQRLEKVRAGARTCVGPWVEPEALRALCRAYVEAKHDADRGAADNLFDPVTDLYNWQGLIRRARELGALAMRQHQAMACLVFAVELREVSAAKRGAAVLQCALSARQSVRLSDAVGQPGDAQFAILVPLTEARGVVGLANRLIEPLRISGAKAVDFDPGDIVVLAGYDAVANLAYEPLDPVTLLLRAGMALRSGDAEPKRPWLRRFVPR